MHRRAGVFEGSLAPGRIAAAVAVLLVLAVATALVRGSVEAAPSQQFLHTAAVTVGGSTYRTLSSAGAAGTLGTVTTSLGTTYTTFASGGVSLFASTAVPAGETWSIAGSWTFDVWVRTNDRADSRVRARVYRIAADGTATPVTTTGPSPATGFTRVETTYTRFTWSAAVPAGTTLATGQRFGVDFQIQTDGDPGTATLGFDTSAQNSGVTAQVAVAALPGAPTAVTAVPGAGEATVSWTAPASDGGSPITSYTVTSSPDGLTATTPNGVTTTAVVTGLTNGTPYTFTVTATNANGTGPASAPSPPVTPSVLPGAPTAVTAVAGNADATVSWTAPASTPGVTITSYTVTSNPGGLTATTANGTITTAVVTGLTNGTAYTFTVTAASLGGAGPPSAPSNAVTPANTPLPPGPPTSVVAVGGNAVAAVQWVAPASTGGSPITSYTVTSTPGGLTATTPSGATTSAVVAGLTNGTSYTFTVTATNANGTGAASAPSNAVTPAPGTPPGAPQGVTALVGNASATVTWTPPLSDGGSLVTSYTVTSTPGGFTATTPDGATTSTLVTGLTNGTSYTFTVTATNANGTGPASAPSNAVTPAPGSPPSAPLGVVAVGGDASATVTWSPPASNGGSPITSYRVTSNPGAIIVVTPNGGVTSAIVVGLTNGTPYTFTVTATNAFGPGPASIPSNAVTPAPQPGVVRASHYRIGRDTPLTAMEWWASTDSAAVNLATNDAFRVRMQVYNPNGQSKPWTPRIEVSTLPDSGYVPLATTTGAAPFHVFNSGAFSNGSSITPAFFGIAEEHGTAIAGSAYDTVNPAAATSIGSFSYTEMEFSVRTTANAVEGQVYYFRMTDNGVPFEAYDAGPALVVVGGALPPEPEPQPPAHNFHQPYTGDTSACAACHRAHSGPAPAVLYKQWPEEAVCYTCHDGSAAPNIKSQFDKQYRMPITATAGIHTKDEARNRVASAFSGANRHVECADCHNPHLAGRGNHTIGSNYAFAPQQGVWGISVQNTAPWAPPAFNPIAQVTFQYQLCYKCHSSWAYGNSPPLSPSGGFPQTDQAKEFNTLNPAYHPVEDVGKNPFQKANGTSYASSLIGGFTPSSRMVCSDCHMSETSGDPAGPHGSTRPFLLRGQWDRTTGRSGTQGHLCFTCHAYSTYGPGSSDSAGTGFSDPDGRNLHGRMVGARNKANNDQPIVCQDCHVAIVHGYQRDHLLGFTGDGQPYVNRPYSEGLVQIDQWRASGQWVFDSCKTAMDTCK